MGWDLGVAIFSNGLSYNRANGLCISRLPQAMCDRRRRLDLKRPQVSIAGMMLVVAVVALDALGARVLYRWHPDFLSAIAPGALILQMCLFRMLRDRGIKRMFWAGCMAGLAVAAGLCLWGMARGLANQLQFDPISGKNVVRWVPGHPMWPGWPIYRAHVYQIIRSFQNGSAIIYRFDAVSMVVLGVVLFLPQLAFGALFGLMALFGALIVKLIARWKPPRAISRRRIPRPKATMSTPV